MRPEVSFKSRSLFSEMGFKISVLAALRERLVSGPKPTFSLKSLVYTQL